MIDGGLCTKGITKHSQENMPLITVVTVVCNGENILEETILSVINQTYTNIEYIIIDGASTDRTLDIIRKYEDRIDYWMSEPDEGIYNAMNKGIDLATGDWINFMNSGDVLYGQSTVEELVSNTNRYDIVYGDTIKSNGKYEKARKLIIMNFGMCFCHQSCIVRAAIMKEQCFNLKYRIGADYYFFLWCRLNNKNFFYLAKPISIYDINGFSARKRVELVKEAMLTVNELWPKRIGVFYLYQITRLFRDLLIRDNKIDTIQTIKILFCRKKEV
ncbi:hypothetical protein AGMMS49579_23600 [Spirochaetia bacterium]|nr:hypothetical protein AGMMS49579_23600 [Spirochaetia bacterium]